MKNNKTTLAKITRPKMAGLLKREIAFSLLDDSRKRPITWISAPAGSGKTSLVATHLESRKIPCLWYHIDKADSDIASFFYYMGIAAKETMPKSKKSLPLFTNEYREGLSVFTQRYFQDLYGCLGRPFTLVFDDYQNVPSESELHAIMAGGLSVIPEGINVIVVSRCEPHPVFIKLRAGEKISRLGWNDICFSEDETKAIVEMKDSRKISDAMIALLHKKTKGWVAGLLLLIESVKLQGADYQLIESLTPDEIFQYFATELFEKRDASMQAFFLKTAFFVSMTAKLAESLTGNKSAARILSQFNSNNYFIEKRLEKDPVYVYHPLFREFLLSRAKEIFTKERISEIQRNAAALLIESGQFEEAAALFCSSENWNELIGLVIQHAHSLTAQGRFSTLAEWIEDIPKEISERNPWLIYWSAICGMAGNPRESSVRFEKAFHLFEKEKDGKGTLLSWAGAVDSILHANDDYKPLDSWIEWLDNYSGGHAVFPYPEIEANAASTMIGALTARQPNHHHIKEWLKRALSAAHSASGTLTASLQVYTYILKYHLWMGDLLSARMLIDKIKKMTGHQKSSPLVFLTYKSWEVYLFLFSGEADRALNLISEAIALGYETGFHGIDSWLWGSAVHAAIMKKEHALAEEFLWNMQQFLKEQQRESYAHYYHLSAWHALVHKEDQAQAGVFAEQSVTICREIGLRGPQILTLVLLTLVDIRVKAFSRAAESLAEAKHLAETMKSAFMNFICLLLEAYAAFETGNERVGLNLLGEGFVLAKRNQFMTMHHFYDRRVMIQLCNKALEHDIEPKFVQDFICKLGLLPERSSETTSKWPWPVKICTLGNFGLVVNQKRISFFTGKVQKKPLAMLKALICFGGRNVNQQQIIDALWPDAEGDSGRSSFKVTLQRLRNLIDRDDAILFQEGRLSLNPRCCWVDIWAFESFLENTDNLESSAACDRLEQALLLYRGNFLEGEEEDPCAISPCERLKSKFFRAVLRLGAFCQRTGETKRALTWYRRALELDPLAEEMYRQQMLCHLADGDRSEALKVYDSCRKNLLLRLHIEPSEKTKAIYATVRA